MTGLTAADFKAIADEIAHDVAEARRWRARIALADKLSNLSDLQAREDALTASIATLEARAAEITAIVATADAAQARLDAIETEFADKEAVLMKRARADAEEIVRRAWSEAETVALDVKKKNAEAVRVADEDLRHRQSDIAGLDRSITEREQRLASINAQIEKLRAKINN
jgi:DNA repair exonuclease SbcCD ATPase subunit